MRIYLIYDISEQEIISDILKMTDSRIVIIFVLKNPYKQVALTYK